jgi:hypothetical protein
LREGKGRDSRRHKVACKLVRLRMKTTAAGVYRKIILNISIYVSTFIF